jgi:hypothetical protein
MKMGDKEKQASHHITEKKGKGWLNAIELESLKESCEGIIGLQGRGILMTGASISTMQTEFHKKLAKVPPTRASISVMRGLGALGCTAVLASGVLFPSERSAYTDTQRFKEMERKSLGTFGKVEKNSLNTLEGKRFINESMELFG